MDEVRKTVRSSSRAPGRTEHRHAPRNDEAAPGDLRQTVTEVLRILTLRRHVFFIPFCLAATAAFVASHYVPRTYEATVTFEQANDAVSVDLPSKLAIATFGYFLSTLEQDMRSDEVMGPIVEELGLADDLPRNPDGTLTAEGLEARERIGQSLAGGVKIAAWKKTPYTHVIRLQYTGADPKVMNQLLSRMKENYIKLVRRQATEKLSDARDWYLAQGDEKRSVLDNIDQQLTAFQLSHPGVDPTNPESIAFQLSSVRNDLSELQRTRSRLTSSMAGLKEFLNEARSQSPADQSAVPGPTISPEATRLHAMVTESESRITDLKLMRGMTDLHPDVIAEQRLQQRYLRELQAQLEADRAAPKPPGSPQGSDAPVPGVWMPAYAQAESELAALAEQLETTNREMQTSEERVAELVQLQGEVFDRRHERNLLQEELDQAREDFETYQRLVAKCDHALTVEKEHRGIIFTNLGSPTGSMLPTSPRAKTVLMLSLLAGVATGVIFVVIAELFDRRFRTSSQVSKALNIPILESIDEIVTAKDRRGRFLRRAVLVPAVVCLMLGMVSVSGGLSYLSLSNPSTYARVISYPKAAWASIAKWTQDPPL